MSIIDMPQRFLADLGMVIDLDDIDIVGELAMIEQEVQERVAEEVEENNDRDREAIEMVEREEERDDNELEDEQRRDNLVEEQQIEGEDNDNIMVEVEEGRDNDERNGEAGEIEGIEEEGDMDVVGEMLLLEAQERQNDNRAQDIENVDNIDGDDGRMAEVREQDREDMIVRGDDGDNDGELLELGEAREEVVIEEMSDEENVDDIDGDDGELLELGQAREEEVVIEEMTDEENDDDIDGNDGEIAEVREGEHRDDVIVRGDDGDNDGELIELREVREEEVVIEEMVREEVAAEENRREPLVLEVEDEALAMIALPEEPEKKVFTSECRENVLEGVAGETRTADRFLAIRFRILCKYDSFFVIYDTINYC
jgi:hypothetical protein